MVETLTDHNFETEIAQSELPCLVLFTGSWCTLCPQMKVTFDTVSAYYDDRLRFFVCDIDSQMKMRIKFAVAALPYIVYIADGMRAPLFDEMVTEDRLRERIDLVLSGQKIPTARPL